VSRVIHTGQALVDVVVEVPGLPARGQNVMATSTNRYAGGSVTVLLAAARFGASCVHAGAHGTGPNGDLIRETLAQERITLSAPRVPGRDTATCIVLVEPSAERTFVTSLGAERQISVGSLSTSAPVAGDLVCVTGYSLALPETRDPLLAWLPTLDPGVLVVLDPGAVFVHLEPAVREAMLAHTDVWSSNAEEAADLLEAVGDPLDRNDDTMTAPARRIAPLLRRYAVTVVRDGAQGCAVTVRGATTVVPGFPQVPVDTNGAGDTHTGALVADVAAGRDWVEACCRANAAAAVKVTRRGPTSAPTGAEVEDFLTSACTPRA
jgi:sugar/nucleoside kinase (ribokinase family)